MRVNSTSCPPKKKKKINWDSCGNTVLFRKKFMKMKELKKIKALTEIKSTLNSRHANYYSFQIVLLSDFLSKQIEIKFF